MNDYKLLLTILISGVLGGVINAVRLDKKKTDYWKSLLKGIAAAFLVPLFLEIIKSEIGKVSTNELYDFLVFGGLCLVSAIFSDRFIDSIGEKILQTVKEADKAAKESIEKANIVIAKSAEPDDNQNDILEEIMQHREFSEISSRQNIQKIVDSLKNEKYNYRTAKGIATETGFLIISVMDMLEKLKEKGFVKQIKIGKRLLWTLVE